MLNEPIDNLMTSTDETLLTKRQAEKMLQEMGLTGTPLERFYSTVWPEKKILFEVQDPDPTTGVRFYADVIKKAYVLDWANRCIDDEVVKVSKAVAEMLEIEIHPDAQQSRAILFHAEKLIIALREIEYQCKAEGNIFKE